MRQVSGAAAAGSVPNRPWVSLAPAGVEATEISGTPGWSMKSRATVETGLPAALSTARQRSALVATP